MASVTGVMPFQHVAKSRHNRGSVGGGGAYVGEEVWESMTRENGIWERDD